MDELPMLGLKYSNVSMCVCVRGGVGGWGFCDLV